MQSVTSHPQIGELLIELDNIESLKIRGALAAVGVVLPEVLMASRPDIVARSHYQSAPILLREGTCIELYWNILLALDRELWGSNLLLANHQSFQLLFTLQERMDREVFPILEASLLSYVEERSIEKSRWTHLIQRSLSSPKEQTRQSLDAKIQHLNLESVSVQEAKLRFDEILSEAEQLPELHRSIFEGASREVKDWWDKYQ